MASSPSPGQGLQSQICLIPDNAKTAYVKEWVPKGPIPRHARDFGYCVDFAVLLPGDLILVSSEPSTFTARLIRKVQLLGGYHASDAAWEHAAVYVMDDTICEATRSGVRIGSIYSYLGTHRIRVRRNPKLTVDERWSLVVNALKSGNYAYGYSSVIGLAIKSWFGFWTKSRGRRMSYPKRAVYCSELYVDAHVKSCGILLGNLEGGESTPASLSKDSKLQDVSIAWTRIV